MNIDNKSVVVYSEVQLINALSKNYREIVVGVDQINLTKTIYIPSNTTLDGRNVTFYYEQGAVYNKLVSNNTVNVELRNINFSPRKKEKYNNHNQGYYPIKLSNVTQAKLCSLNFTNTINTCIGLFDCHDFVVTDCVFQDIGLNTGKNINYSYDGVFIGAYTKGSKDIRISNCVFTNIGMVENQEHYKNDGDGIQMYSKSSTIDNIIIEDCFFENISRRGIKIQSGSNYTIRNNSFESNKMAIGVAMESSTYGIVIENNVIQSCIQGIFTNSYHGNPCFSDSLVVKRNKFYDLSGVIRTSGSSSIVNGIINGNIVDTVKSYFFEGRLSSSEMSDNTISHFQYKPVENSTVAAVYLWNGSKQNIISNNSFVQDSTSYFDIYLYPNSIRNEIIQNKSISKKRNRKIGVRNLSKLNIIKH